MPQYSQTFVKKDPVTGLTFYDFEGHIKATGLDLDTSTDLTTIGSTIRWLSAVNTAAQQIWGTRLRFIDRIPHIDVSSLRLMAFKPDAYSGPTLSAYSELIVSATETDTGLDRGAITATVGSGNDRTILDQVGASDFLQLLSTQKLRVAVGNGPIPWPGGSSQSSAVGWNHGLGVNPVFHCAFMRDQSGTGPARCYGISFSSVSISFQFSTEAGFAPSAGNQGSFCAVAIG